MTGCKSKMRRRWNGFGFMPLNIVNYAARNVMCKLFSNCLLYYSIVTLDCQSYYICIKLTKFRYWYWYWYREFLWEKNLKIERSLVILHTLLQEKKKHIRVSASHDWKVHADMSINYGMILVIYKLFNSRFAVVVFFAAHVPVVILLLLCPQGFLLHSY